MDQDLEDVRRFLHEHVETYEQLESLLVLYETSGTYWNAESLDEKLAGARPAAAQALDELARIGLVERALSGAMQLYKYEARNPEIAARVALLAQHYRSDRIEIMKMMSANAIERVRTAAMRTFAEAFVVGGKKKDG